MRYLITGGSGYIGGRLTDELSAARRPRRSSTSTCARRPAHLAEARVRQGRRPRSRRRCRSCSSSTRSTRSSISPSSSTRSGTRTGCTTSTSTAPRPSPGRLGRRRQAGAGRPPRRPPTAPSPTTRSRSPRTGRCAGRRTSPTPSTRPSPTASASSGPSSTPTRVMTIVRPSIVFGPSVDNYIVRAFENNPFMPMLDGSRRGVPARPRGRRRLCADRAARRQARRRLQPRRRRPADLGPRRARSSARRRATCSLKNMKRLQRRDVEAARPAHRGAAGQPRLHPLPMGRLDREAEGDDRLGAQVRHPRDLQGDDARQGLLPMRRRRSRRPRRRSPRAPRATFSVPGV